MGVRQIGGFKIPTPKQVEQAMNSALTEAMKDGQEEMRRTIDTTGASIYPAPRSETGAMREAVEYRVEDGGGKATGELGWFDLVDSPDRSSRTIYMKHQEEGVDNHYYWGVLIPGKTIPALNARRAAKLVVDDTLEGHLGKEFGALF